MLLLLAFVTLRRAHLSVPKPIDVMDAMWAAYLDFTLGCVSTYSPLRLERLGEGLGIGTR